ncbi:MAG: protein TolQ [Desulfatiglandaceae bacterium]
MFQIPFVHMSIGASMNTSIMNMISNADIIVKLVLIILLIFSIVTWSIIFLKIRLLTKARKETNDFLELFWENKGMKKIYMASKGLDYSPVARLFRAGYAEFSRMRKLQAPPESTGRQEFLDIEDSPGSRRTVMYNLERSLNKAAIDQGNRLERALSFLATTGNTAPFIGLFGTVWGIMESFRNIGIMGSASLAVVAPGISEALIATATGLAAAIPAVVAYNYFLHKIGLFKSEMEIFSSEFLSMVERQFFREKLERKA